MHPYRFDQMTRNYKMKVLFNLGFRESILFKYDDRKFYYYQWNDYGIQIYPELYLRMQQGK